MPNGVKFTTNNEPRAISSGNAKIDVGSQIGGPTYKTGFFNSITPPDNGYTLYEDKKGPIVEDDLVYAIDPSSYVSYKSDLGLNEVWDLSGNLKTGILNDVTYNSNNEGIFTFNGSTSYINVDDTNSSLNFIETTGIYTISVWVNCQISIDRMTILSTNEGSTSDKGFRIFKNPFNDIQLQITKGISGQYVIDHISSINLNDSQWYNITAVGDGSVNEFFVNGDSIGSTESFNSFSVGNSNNLNIGRSGSNGVYWDGSVGFVSIYNTNLNDSQIQQNYLATKGRFI